MFRINLESLRDSLQNIPTANSTYKRDLQWISVEKEVEPRVQGLEMGLRRGRGRLREGVLCDTISANICSPRIGNR